MEEACRGVHTIPGPGYYHPNIMTEYILIFRKPGDPIFRAVGASRAQVRSGSPTEIQQRLAKSPEDDLNARFRRDTGRAKAAPRAPV